MLLSDLAINDALGKVLTAGHCVLAQSPPCGNAIAKTIRRVDIEADKHREIRIIIYQGSIFSKES
ncbi:MAG: hypothetical protein AAGE37_01005 [Pseudomonadota bacterium]